MVCKNRVVESIFDIPTSEQILNSKNELGEDDERMKSAEEILYKWLERETHLPKIYERNIVRNFLRGAKHDIEKTKTKLENYFYTRHACPELYSNWDTSRLLNTIDNVHIAFLPKLTKCGFRICYFSIENPEMENFNIEDIGKLFLMIYDIVLMAEAPVSGEILIFDAAKFSGNHLIKFLSPIFKELLTVLTTSYCVRINQIHIINAPNFIEKILLAVRPLVHEKVKKRFIVHKNSKTILNHLTPDVLPAELEGDLDSIKVIINKWKDTLNNNSEWLKNREEIKTEKPPKKHRGQFQNTIGVTGTFRRLTID